jgi:serine protease Do
MKQIIIFTFIICIYVAISNSEIEAVQPEINRHFIDAVSAAKPAVVNIIIYSESGDARNRNLSKVGYGSGTVISSSGYIVTNYHVLEKGDFFQVILYDGKECQPVLLQNNEYFMADVKTDIALLMVEQNEISHIKPISFGDSNSLSEGEWVIAIGNPFGLKQSVSSGIVSSMGRSDIGFADIEDFIQTDVPINPGNSGGPLINLDGRLVGINTAIRTKSGGYQGISFAIPSNIVRQVCSELMQFGRVRRGWIGFLAKERMFAGRGEKKILEIISVIKNSPADISGMQKGDIIKEIDGKAISTLGELINLVNNKPIGSDLNIIVSRDAKVFKYKVILREKDTYKNIQKALENIYSAYGIDLDKNSATSDIVISYLSPMSIAYQSGLKKGDIILSVNGSPVSGLEELVKEYNKTKIIFKLEIFRDPTKYLIMISGE